MEFLSHVVEQSKEIAGKPFYTIAEYLPDHPGEISSAKTNSVELCFKEVTIEQGGPCDGTWHDSFYWVLKRALLSNGTEIELESLKSIIDCRKQGYETGKNVVNYISNHDHDRLVVELGKEKQYFKEQAFHSSAISDHCFSYINWEYTK